VSHPLSPPVSQVAPEQTRMKSNVSKLAKAGSFLDVSIFVLLLAVIVVTAIPYGTVEPWWEALFECEVFAITAIWLFEGLLRGSWQLRRLFILLPLILITAFAFAQTIVWPVAWLPIGLGRLTSQHTLSVDRYQTYLTARKALALTAFLGLLLVHTSTPRRLRWLVRVVMGLGLASALFGILRQLLQSPDSPTGFVLPFLFAGLGYGQFIYHNAFAYLMEMTFAVTAGLVLGGGIRRDRILINIAIALLVWAALVLSLSRGAVLSLACQAIFLLFTSWTWYSARRLAREDERRHRWLRFIQSSILVRTLVIVIIAVTLIVGVFWMGGQKFASRVRELDSNREPIDALTRRTAWSSTWELIKDNPWTGVGFGAYFLAIPEYLKGAGRIRLEQAHNDYLDLPANGGLVAVGLAVWFIGIIIWRIRSRLRSADAYRRAACLGAAAGILSVGVHSVVDFGLQVTAIAVVFAALVVIAVADSRVESVSPTRGRINDRRIAALRDRPESRRYEAASVTGIEGRETRSETSRKFGRLASVSRSIRSGNSSKQFGSWLK